MRLRLTKPLIGGTVAMAMLVFTGCSKGTPATDKALVMATKVHVTKSELIFGDPTQYSGHKFQQLKLTIKNDNAEPVETVIANVVLQKENGEALDLPDTVIFSADGSKGESAVAGFSEKADLPGKAFESYNEIPDSSYINTFQIKSITPTEAFKDQAHFDAYIAEKADQVRQ